MIKFQTLTPTPRMVARPRCPQCQAAAIVQRSTAGRTGSRCTKCGHIHEAQVQTEPMTSEANRWLSSELRSPT
jgi:tRNA(Ile2) C34 agmatinyltransferase TiaS